jgi:hypothetical protein
MNGLEGAKGGKNSLIIILLFKKVIYVKISIF